MYFQLLKLVVWPKKEKFAPRMVDFEPGKVNVITGLSRSGKSAIIPIIDYCLASSDCSIPIDTIRDHASWYGVIFQTETEQLLICRKVPEGTKVSNDFYLSRGPVVSVPPCVPDPNHDAEQVKHILNTVSYVPYFSIDTKDDRNRYGARLSFRDLMAFVFQSQDIVANQNVLFYKTHAHDHRERLRNWFPFILGAETIDTLIARQRLQDVEKRLNQLRREYDKARAVSSSWVANMLVHLKIAKEYGLIDEEISSTCAPDELIAMARKVTENIPNHSQSKVENIKEANQEVSKLEAQESKISTEIGNLQRRLNEIKRLKSGLVDYGDYVRKRVERLHISQWLEDIATDSELCPACGSKEHPSTKVEMAKICAAFRQYEEQAKAVSEVPTSFSREEERLTRELSTLLEQQKSVQKEYETLLVKDNKAKQEFQRRKNMFLFIGHLKASLEIFETLADGGEIQKDIEKLQAEQKALTDLIDSAGLSKRVNVATYRISQGMLDHLTTLDVEEKYRQTPPMFNVKDLNLKVLSNDENWHFLAEVGSASNWVSFHIALMCSMQEFFINKNNTCVPSFVIFDQPSQVYFPKVQRSQRANADDVKFESEDEIAVTNMFKTIARSVAKSKGKWQGIILDHADAGIYGGVDGVHEVEEWRDGNKLIPLEWLA